MAETFNLYGVEIPMSDHSKYFPFESKLNLNLDTFETKEGKFIQVPPADRSESITWAYYEVANYATIEQCPYLALAEMYILLSLENNGGLTLEKLHNRIKLLTEIIQNEGHLTKRINTTSTAKSS